MQDSVARTVPIPRACGHVEHVDIEGDAGRLAWLFDRLRHRSCSACRSRQGSVPGATVQTEMLLGAVEPVAVAMRGGTPDIVAWARRKRERLMISLADHGLRGPAFQAHGEWAADRLDARLGDDARAWAAWAAFDARTALRSVGEPPVTLPPSRTPPRKLWVEGSTGADPSGVYLMRDSLHCFVLAPRNETFLALAARHGGVWQDPDRVWSFPLVAFEVLRGVLRAVYGTEGLEPVYASESAMPAPPPAVLHQKHGDYVAGIGNVEAQHHLMPLFGSELQVLWARQIRASLYSPRNLHDDDGDEFEEVRADRLTTREFFAIRDHCGLDAHRWIKIMRLSGHERYDLRAAVESAADLIEDLPAEAGITVPAIMPEITLGSDRQIAWATQIRFEVFQKLAEYGRASSAHAQIVGLVLPGLAVLPGASAKAWIERCDADAATLIGEAVGHDRMLIAKVRRLLRANRPAPVRRKARTRKPETDAMAADTAADLKAVLDEATACVDKLLAEVQPSPVPEWLCNAGNPPLPPA